MLKPKSWSIDWGGRKLSIEINKMAFQADASCLVQYGETTILATVVKSKNVRDIDFFPLMTEFEERLYAAGKIKGSRFIKREGRPSDEAILSARMIDRAIRPLFDESIRNDVQVVLTALSVDNENDASFVGLLAASVVLSISKINWHGPIAGARIGLNANDEFVLNITDQELEINNKLDLLVAGTPEKLVMVEARASEIPEEQMFSAMKWGCEQMKAVVDLIKKIQEELGVVKEEKTVTDLQDPKEIVNQMTKDFIAAQTDSKIFNSPKVSKDERNKMIDELKHDLKEFLTGKEIKTDKDGAIVIGENLIENSLKNIKEYICSEISKRILEKDQRLDGRKLTDIRELYSEIDLLPRVHGSAMFMRGDTQVVSIVTLGAPGDVQTLDSMEEDGTKRYMHHYNDSPFAYGEAAPMRGPSRRAVGHGALAEKALLAVLPSEEEFPYAIRVVSEVMGSNGSSSMASTCGSSLSLMAAGVPIKKAVAGIAMGLASDENGNWKVLTDLQDVEDGKGGMDFKIAGTADGITAIQMDTKTNGLNWDLVKQTIKQAREARLQVLGVMNSAIVSPRAELSKYAPRIETIQINPEKIKDVIGPGGKVINKIIAETGVQIDIEQDGRVLITSSDGEGMKKAIKMVTDLTKEIEAGEIYDGKVVRLEDFGAFVELLPGKDGLVHVSEISWERTNKPSDVLKLGDVVKVKVKEIDNMGRVNLSMKILKDKPENFTENNREDRGPRNSDRNNRGNGNFRNNDRRNDYRHGNRNNDRNNDRNNGRPNNNFNRNHSDSKRTGEKPVVKVEEKKEKKGLIGSLFGKK
ncbi:MAG: polyribonucleotide nucleotidyltransferase [Patescibacteria group bacterium]